MSDYSAYPSYKPSGLDWLGEMPSHWELRRLKFIASVTYSNVDKHTKEDEIPVRLCNYVDVYKNDHITNDLEFMEATADSGEIKKFGLQKGDVIVTKDSEEWKDIAVPAFVPENLEGVICGYHLALIRPYSNQMDGEYLFRAFRAPAINYQFQVAASGITRYGLGKQALGDAWIIMPPLPEQRTIAAFLDRETAYIDSLIAKKLELIDLLDKKRTSIISHAVTKGLNPNARMKPSGVEWLGDVPEEWEILPLRRVVKSVKTGSTPSGARVSAFEENGFNWYTPSDFVESIILSKSSRSLSLEGKGEVPIFPPMTVMLVGIGATIGKVGLSLVESSCNQQIHGIVCDQRLDPLFTTYYIRTLRDFIIKFGKYTTLPIMNQEETKNLLITLPPLVEQRIIAEYLNHETARIDELVKQIAESIRLLQKQRLALISAAVTGKIDVREQGN